VNNKPRRSICERMSGPCLIEAMELVQELCAVGHRVRAENKLRVRQPLQKLEIVDPAAKWTWLAFAPDMVDMIKDEVNVKEIRIFSDSIRVVL